MSHDKNGTLIQPGDRVTVEFEVEAITGGTDFCNATLRFVEPIFPSDRRDTLSAINTRQVLLIKKAQE